MLFLNYAQNDNLYKSNEKVIKIISKRNIKGAWEQKEERKQKKKK